MSQHPHMARASLAHFFVCTLIALSMTGVSTSVMRSQPPSPKREVRAVWITTVNGLDWPKTTDVMEQRRSLREIIQRLYEAGFNTVFFQVRGRADAYYRSRYEPWAQPLTGRQGADPGWDPLQFVLEEAHERGMEVHAWFNTFLIRSGKSSPFKEMFMPSRLQQWKKRIDNDWWFDPGIPEVRAYTLDVALDIVRQYDIDGIQFDYMRYPGSAFPDAETFRWFGKGSTKEDWRRENINKFVKAVYDSVMKIKPMLKVGSAPIGVYMNTKEIRGLQSYSELFQDSRAWLSRRTQDYLAPQLYWSLGTKPGNPDFATVALEWSEHSYGRHLYFGVGAFKPEVHGQLADLIDASRKVGADGNAFFRYESISDALDLGGRYKFPALIPPMPWKDHQPPNPPTALHVDNPTDDIFALRWTKPSLAFDGDPAMKFVIYRSASSPVDVDRSSNILALIPASRFEYSDTILHVRATKYYYAVSALDRGNNESTPSVERGVVVPALAALARQFQARSRMGNPYRSPHSSIMFFPYELSTKAPVFVKVLDGANAEVATVVDAQQAAGMHVAAADLSRLRPGTYSLLFITGETTEKTTLQIGN